MAGLAFGATAAGLLDDNNHSDVTRLQKAKDNLTQTTNNILTGADKDKAILNAHVDAISDGDLTDVAENQAILNVFNQALTKGTRAEDSSVYLTQGTFNQAGQEVKGQANINKGHTYLNIDHIDSTVETLNHEIAHHNGQGETSATTMGKIGNIAYNIGTSLNQEEINTHRQAIIPTAQALNSLSTAEQLAIYESNQAILEHNQAQKQAEVEEGDGFESYTPAGTQGQACTGVECSDRVFVAQANACKTGQVQCTDYIKKGSQYILVGASLLPLVGDAMSFAEAESAGDYFFATIGVLPGAGDAVQKAHRSYKAAKKARDVKGMKTAVESGVNALGKGKAQIVSGEAAKKKAQKGEIDKVFQVVEQKKAQTAKQSTSHAKSPVVHKEVELVDHKGSPLGELDGIDLANGIFYEDKKAGNFHMINPRTGMPQQTEAQWARKQIYDKTATRIKALKNAASTRATKNGTADIPTLQQIKNINHFVFRLEGDSPKLREATQKQIDNLKKEFPNYTFEVIYGAK